MTQDWPTWKPNYEFFIFSFQSFVSSGDYDDEDDYPDLNERLESYKSKSCPGEHVILKVTCIIKFIAVKHNAFVQVFYFCNFIHGFIFLSFLCRLQSNSWNSTRTIRVTLVSCCPFDYTMKDCCTDIDPPIKQTKNKYNKLCQKKPSCYIWKFYYLNNILNCVYSFVWNQHIKFDISFCTSNQATIFMVIFVCLLSEPLQMKRK